MFELTDISLELTHSKILKHSLNKYFENYVCMLSKVIISSVIHLQTELYPPLKISNLAF